MGPYDIYIWPSYIITAIVLLAMAVISWRTKMKDAETLRTLEAQMRDMSEETGRNK